MEVVDTRSGDRGMDAAFLWAEGGGRPGGQKRTLGWNGGDDGGVASRVAGVGYPEVSTK